MQRERPVLPETSSPDQRRSGRLAPLLSQDQLWRLLLGAQASVGAYGRVYSADAKETLVHELQSPLPGSSSRLCLDLSGALEGASRVAKNVLVQNNATDAQAWMVAFYPAGGRVFLSQDDASLVCELPDTLHIIVAFRGSGGMQEWRTPNISFESQAKDFFSEDTIELCQSFATGQGSLGPCVVHSKFYAQWASIRDAVFQQLKEVLGDVGRGANWDVQIVGHSAGGALASLCAFDVLERGVAPCSKTSLHTFGAAAVGNKAFADALDFMMCLDTSPQRALLVVNSLDPVPAIQVPIGGMNSFLRCNGDSSKAYQQPGTLVWMNETPGKLNTLRMGKAARLQTSIARLCGSNKVQSASATTDHSSGEYVEKVASLFVEKGGAVPLCST